MVRKGRAISVCPASGAADWRGILVARTTGWDQSARAPTPHPGSGMARPPPEYGCSASSGICGAESASSPLLPGHTYRVSVTMLNTGSETWTSAEGYRLGSQNPRDNGTWGLSRVELPYPVAPNRQVTFSFWITAPATPAAYDFQWRMVHESFTWFGEVTPGVLVYAHQRAPQAFDAGYDVGPNYHSTTGNFANAAFISLYHDPSVRGAVIEQLQTMADTGASIVKTMLWLVGTPPDEPPASWHLSFPLSEQELSNIETYA